MIITVVVIGGIVVAMALFAAASVSSDAAPSVAGT